MIQGWQNEPLPGKRSEPPGQRIAVVGLKEADFDAFWNDVQMNIGYAIGLCVRMVKFCLGTTEAHNGT
mgnify:CR=1 FL=1|jgi:NAD(P)H-nitrite reductase large subunit